MSGSLVWKPVEQASGSFGFELKRALGRWKFGGDGSVWPSGIVLSIQDAPALEAMKAAGVEEAGDLAELIHEHGSIELWVEF